MPEYRIKAGLVEVADVADDFDVMDLGCGTGTLLVIAHQMHPGARWCGIDPDPAVLGRARRKLRRAGTGVRLELASATALPFRAGSFDRILSTLVFHHLDLTGKKEALRESLRVLRPGGEIHIADFGPPRGRFTRATSFLVEHLGREHVSENFRGMLPGMIAAAGFQGVVETRTFVTVFGMVRTLRGEKP